jgi:hypothetical protein
MKALLFGILVFISILQTVCAEDSLSVIRVLSQNRQIALSEDTQQRVRQQVADLVRSSSFVSSSDAHHIFTFAGVQQDYRDVVATGEYLLLIFSSPQKFTTGAGEITAAEIVVGLHSPGGQNCLFTIDEQGRIVSHAKYSGMVLMSLKDTLAHAHP